MLNNYKEVSSSRGYITIYDLSGSERSYYPDNYVFAIIILMSVNLFMRSVFPILESKIKHSYTSKMYPIQRCFFKATVSNTKFMDIGVEAEIYTGYHQSVSGNKSE